MCRQLPDIRHAIRQFASSFEAARYTGTDLSTIVSEAAAIEAIASTVKALAAAGLADSFAWRRAGFRSEAEQLAHLSGATNSAARSAVETGRRIGSQPIVDNAARSGELSATQAALISDAVAANPAVAEDLVTQAQTSSVAELADAVAEIKAAAEPDPEEKRRKIRAKRRLRAWTDLEGAWHLSANGNPEDGAQIMAALAPRAEAIFDKARKEGRREHPSAYWFDALVYLGTDATSQDSSPTTKDDSTEKPGKTRPRRGAAVKLLLRVDWDAFLRGTAIDGELCELAGYGPVAMSVVYDLIEQGDPFVAAILTKAQALVGVAHLGRRPNAYQQTALEWLYPSCAVEGCAARARLETDHRVEWSKTHFTVLDLLDELCEHHHDLKTREGWELVDGKGKRAFVPPGDPRHPGRRRRTSAA